MSSCTTVPTCALAPLYRQQSHSRRSSWTVSGRLLLLAGLPKPSSIAISLLCGAPGSLAGMCQQEQWLGLASPAVPDSCHTTAVAARAASWLAFWPDMFCCHCRRRSRHRCCLLLLLLQCRPPTRR